MVEAKRRLDLEKKTRFYQASTSELYGLVHEAPQKETMPFKPRLNRRGEIETPYVRFAGPIMASVGIITP